MTQAVARSSQDLSRDLTGHTATLHAAMRSTRSQRPHTPVLRTLLVAAASLLVLKAMLGEHGALPLHASNMRCDARVNMCCRKKLHEMSARQQKCARSESGRLSSQNRALDHSRDVFLPCPVLALHCVAVPIRGALT